MRRSLSFVLVMLLVLRGLLGDAMAMGLVPASLPTAPLHHQTAMAAEGGAGNHQQHPMGIDERATVTAAFEPACAADEADCAQASGDACSACGVCHSAMFTSAALALQLTHQSFALRPVGHTPFASAAAALAIKPPIS